MHWESNWPEKVSGLDEIPVRLNPIELYIFVLNAKSQRLLLHERNDPMKPQDVSVVELSCRLLCLYIPCIYSSQRVFFDKPPQIEKIVFKFLIVLHGETSLSCSIPRMTSANSRLRAKSSCQC